MSRYFFIHVPTGWTWQVNDPISWCLLHSRDEAILALARERLTVLGPEDADRIIRLVVRRCRLNLLIVQADRVLVHFWGKEGRADLRPFFKSHGLARPGVEVFLLRRKDEFVTVCSGDDFLFGERQCCFPWDVYKQKWDRRNQQEADDRTPAPRSDTNFSWAGLTDQSIPWSVLKCIWQREQAPGCPNCDTPLVTLRFWWRRRVWIGTLNSTLTRGCFACRRAFDEDFPGDFLEWLVTTLDSGLWPTHHRMDRRYDLTRTYADLLKKLEEGCDRACGYSPKGDGQMAKKRSKRRRLRSCENHGGLGILPCESDWPAEVTLKVDPAFVCSDSETLHLCWECAEAFIEHARGFDVEVEIVKQS